MRKVDKLGRIVIPLELRKKYGLNEGTNIEFIDGGDGVTIKSTDPFCKICRARIRDDISLPICEECIAEVLKQYK